MFCVLGVVLQTILDVYNCFTCIVSLYRNDPTPRKIDRWLVFQTLYIYIYIYAWFKSGFYSLQSEWPCHFIYRATLVKYLCCQIRKEKKYDNLTSLLCHLTYNIYSHLNNYILVKVPRDQSHRAKAWSWTIVSYACVKCHAPCTLNKFVCISLKRVSILHPLQKIYVFIPTHLSIFFPVADTILPCWPIPPSFPYGIHMSLNKNVYTKYGVHDVFLD